MAVESSLPRPSAWSRLVPTSLAAGEPSPALLVRTRRSTTQPTLPRIPSVPPGQAARQAASAGPRRRPKRQELFRRQEETKDSATLSAPGTRGETKTKKDSGDKDSGRSVRPTFVAWGSAPRSAPRSAPFLAPPLLLSLHPSPCGGRGSQFWPRAKEIIPPK